MAETTLSMYWKHTTCNYSSLLHQFYHCIGFKLLIQHLVSGFSKGWYKHHTKGFPHQEGVTWSDSNGLQDKWPAKLCRRRAADVQEVWKWYQDKRGIVFLTHIFYWVAFLSGRCFIQKKNKRQNKAECFFFFCIWCVCCEAESLSEADSSSLAAGLCNTKLFLLSVYISTNCLKSFNSLDWH